MRYFDGTQHDSENSQESEPKARPPVEDLVRLSVNLNPETAAALKRFADDRGLSFTEAVRRMISISTFISDEISEGRQVQVVDRRHRVVSEIEIY